MLQKAKANIIKAQQKQKRYYDMKHFHPEIFEVGFIVLKKDLIRKRR